MPTFMKQTDLSIEEQRMLTGQLVAALTEQERIKAEAAASASEYRTDLQSIAKRIHELKVTLESGRGQIEIDVDERPAANGVVELFAAGTDEKVGERPMRAEDRQTEIPMGGAGGDVDLSDEQDAASTPAEAEAMRSKRLELEHAARTAGLAAAARENITVTALEAGGFLAQHGDLREMGETEDEAREKVLALYVEALPAFEAPQPTWDEIQAAAAAETEAPVEEAPVAHEAETAVEDAPKVPLLKVPKGAKSRARRVRVVDATDPANEKEVEEAPAIAAEVEALVEEQRADEAEDAPPVAEEPVNHERDFGGPGSDPDADLLF